VIVELARGGMGDVYLAVSQGPGGFHKLVVIKELRGSLASDHEFLTMFMAEARLSARLHHPNIVQTNEVGQDGNRYFMAMEYLEGQTLHRAIQRIPRAEFPLALQLRLLVDILGGLHYAHELVDYDGTSLHIVHRDMSPHNVLITYDGQAKVVDFGIAKTRDSAQQTATGVLKGKVPYMAPEQLDRNQDRRADIFAVGVMLWEAVVGQRLWAGKTDLGIVQALAEQKIPSIKKAMPDVPPELERIVSRALAPNVDDRYPTAQELATDLEAYLDSIGARVSTKEIGKLLVRTFAEEREQIRAVIETQLKQVKVTAEEDDGGSIPRLELAQAAGEMTPSGRSGLSGAKSGRTPAAAALDVVGSAPHGEEIGELAPPPSPVRKIAAIGGAAVVLVAGILIGRAALHRDAPVVPSASTSTPAAPPPATGRGPAADQVEVVLTASPGEARLFLDDSPVESNPYKTYVPKGPGLHRIRAEAPGFSTANEIRSFDKDSVVTLVLERVAKPSNAGARAPAPPQRAQVRPQPAPQPQQQQPQPAATSHPASGARTIDTSDPYSR
jgi:serine/threonine-protein kinase